jgi:hypothetical protein
MARVAVQLTNFTGGELSPRLDGRNDVAKYGSGCKTLKNMIVYPHGSATRRPGTNFVNEVKTSSQKTRLIPFEFSTEQTYILEFGNQYIRFIRNGGAVLESNRAITGITKANPGVVTGSIEIDDYPTIETVSTYTSGGSSVTNPAVTLPAGIKSGELLILIAKPGSTNTITKPDGWNETIRNDNGLTYIFYKVADGSEGGTQTLTTVSHLTAIGYRISGYNGNPEITFATTNVNNPPSATASWGSSKNLFISVLSSRTSNDTVTAAPTNYTDLITIANDSNASTTHTLLASASREYTSASDNPDAFTVSGTLDNPHSATIIIRGIQNNYNNGDTIVITGVGGMTQVNNKRFIISNKTSTTFELKNTDGNNVNTSSYTTYTSGGIMNRVYEIQTNYLESELPDIKYAQSADVMYLCHPNHPVQKLSRTGHTSWTIEDVLFTNGPFLDHNITETKLTPSAFRGTGVTFTASSTDGINNGDGFKSTDVGRLIHLGIERGNAEIVSVTNESVVVADVLEPLAQTPAIKLKEELSSSDTTISVSDVTDFPSTGTILIENEEITYTGKDNTTSPHQFTGCTRGANGTTATTHSRTEEIYLVEVKATTDWALGSFSDTTGYPSCVTFFEQRLVFAATKDQPQTLFFSKSGDYENFDENYHGDVVDDDSIVYTIASNQVNAITFLSATRTLIIGTVGGEFSCSGGGTDEAITPTNILIKKQSSHGCANIDAISVGNVTLFLQRAKRKIRELAYNFDVDGYVAPDLTILAEHITDSGINEMSYQQEPNQTVWCVRDDGRLIGLTYQREQQVVAWHHHIFGGSFGTGNAVCESIATIPTSDTEYQTWVIVKRTVNGVTRRYIEYINTFDFDETDNTSFNFLDSQLSYSGSAVTTLTGLDHLEGQTVSVLANGATHPDITVSSGSITLLRSATNVKIGLPYTSILQTMRLDAGSQDGTSQAKTKRIFDIAIRLYESIGVEVGPDLNNMESIPFRSSANAMDQAIPVFTGDKEIEFRGNYETDGYIFVRQTQPLPLTVLSLYPRLVTNDG